MSNEKKEPLYIQIYNYYKELIASGTLEAGSKLPSIRRCASERMVSRTTVEGAYLQLAAEGYIISTPGSGFYVSELNYLDVHSVVPLNAKEIKKEEKILYDFASSSVDYKSFNFDLWRRYIKSALRNTERLLAYGDTQGEYDLRVALSHYIRERRGVVCTPEQIVIGAGVQSLLHILCSLTENTSPVAFTGMEFKQGEAIFKDRGFQTFTNGPLTSDFSRLEKQGAQIIYTSPSHTTPWGDVMPMQIRLELLAFAEKNNSLIIEDDYDSEFRYYSRPVPSLQGLDGGRKVVYMGTFSKLLLPALRISFMVLPLGLLRTYNEKGYAYNQTASTTEQIALCQFIRDGHLEKQIKKARKLYMIKNHALCSAVERIFKNKATVLAGAGGFLIQLEVKTSLSAKELAERAKKVGVLVKTFNLVGESKYPRLLLSCSSVAEGDFEPALTLLRKAFFAS